MPDCHPSSVVDDAPSFIDISFLFTNPVFLKKRKIHVCSLRGLGKLVDKAVLVDKWIKPSWIASNFSTSPDSNMLIPHFPGRKELTNTKMGGIRLVRSDRTWFGTWRIPRVTVGWLLMIFTTSRFVTWLGAFSQERQNLWLPKDDLKDSDSWSSFPVTLHLSSSETSTPTGPYWQLWL